MEYTVTFYSHFSALTFFGALKKEGISAELVPVPRKLSSSCGTCVKFRADSFDGLSELLDDDAEAVFAFENGAYKCVKSF